MSDKKTTAVQWLIVQMQTFEFLHLDRNKILVKALEMDKQQAFEFWQGGIACTEEGGKSFDQYYNETFQP